jgi:DNA replication protein DnaC
LNSLSGLWCDRVNATYKKHIRAILRELFAVERSQLKPLPAWIPEVYRLHQGMVDTEGYVALHTNRYSVPATFIGRRVEVRETREKIEIELDARRIVTHTRILDADRRVTLSEHRPPRGEARKRSDPHPEEQTILQTAPEIAAYIEDLKRKGRKVTGLALRQAAADVVRVSARFISGRHRRGRAVWPLRSGPCRTHDSAARPTRFLFTGGHRRMTEELEQLFSNLKLHRMRAVYGEQLQAAEKQQITYADFLAGLLRAQWRDRQENALEWRIRRAGMPERWSLDTFPYAKQPGVNRKQIRAFAELDFVAKHENLVLIGPTGVGKTGLACGILLKALQDGLRCQFIRAQDLFDEMYASLADRSTRRLVNRLARLDILLIDEMGYANLKPEQANVFFKLMEERYHQRSTIITTNLAYEEWAGFLGNKTMVEALLSRVRHYCHTVRIEGPSLREPQG